MGFSKQQILLSSNFVQPLSQPKPYTQKEYDIAFCGRMVGQKGIDDFVDVVRAQHKTTQNFRAVMIGVGPELERIKTEVAAEKLPIDVVGYAEDATKFELLSRSKLFVFPSVEEGWGIVVAEALSVGTPVLAYNLPVYGPVFGEHVHTVPLRDHEALRQKTGSLLDSFASHPESYLEEQRAVFEYARQFRLEQVAERESNFIGA
jgi:glycosyltransferase involved in cell wall biosynthesis